MTAFFMDLFKSLREFRKSSGMKLDEVQDFPLSLSKFPGGKNKFSPSKFHEHIAENKTENSRNLSKKNPEIFTRLNI